MASITKYGDGWRAQVFKHGTRVSKTFTSKRDAVVWGRDKELELDTLKSHGKTFGMALNRYFETVSSNKDTKVWEGRRLEAFREYFGDGTKLAKITSDTISLWRDDRLKGVGDALPVSGSTVNREANVLRNLFSVACNEWKWIDTNPFKGVKLPKENVPREAVWTFRQMLRVAHCKRDGKTGEVIKAFRIALHTGLRLGEVFGSEYDARRRVLILGKTKGTRRGQRVEVPVHSRSAKVLEKLYPVKFTANANEAGVLFSKLCKSLLIKGLTFHDTRATALTLLARKVDVLTLARISRHKDLRILMNTYYRETAEQIAKRL